MENVSVVTEILVNILLGCFCLTTLSWVAVGIQTFVNDHKREKREDERSKNDAEYHLKRMEEFKK